MSLFKFSIVIFALLLCEFSSFSHGFKQGRRSKRASAIGPKWPTKRIPFAFDNIAHFDVNNRAKIKHALKLFQESLNVDGETCLEFVERSNESDYIQFVKEDGCFTYVGYRPGKNVISLGPKCIQTDIVMHEIVHKRNRKLNPIEENRNLISLLGINNYEKSSLFKGIGFDHEHSSSNRDQYIQVLLNHTNSASQFTQNHAQSETELDAPYDFHSIVHYSSYDASNDIFGSRPVLLSKLPVLISTSNEIEFQSNLLTPIDVYKIQRFYGCRTIPVPDIVQASNETAEKDRFDTVITRFALEGSFKRISSDVMTKYLEKSIKVCGFNHYWPVNYPLVESNHPLYKLMCLRKKKKNERCKFSFECLDDKTICLRPFYWPTGYCVRSENTKINLALQKSHDIMIKFGDVVKKTFSPKA